MNAEQATAGAPRFRLIAGRAAGIQWAALIGLSIVFVLILQALRLPASLLLGPVAAAIVIAGAEGKVRVPQTLAFLAQGVVGCMIARSITPSILSEIGRQWPLFIVGVLSVVVAANGLGWLLTRWQVLPGTVAIWGSSPGAATPMVLMSEAHGADFRLVAFMQYLRVICVALVASLVARFHGASSARPAVAWFPPIVWLPLIETCAIAVIGSYLGRRLRIPAGPLLLPMAAAVVLQGTGVTQLELPQWLLAISYALVAWTIGLRFTRPILLHAGRALPRVLASTLALIAACAALGAVLGALTGIDPLTAYLATSPGGANSVAIIAASSAVNVPFVVAMQTARLLTVIITGPRLARFIARRSGIVDRPPQE